MGESELELRLALDGVAFELAPDVVVEFTARRTDVTPQRPHGVSYVLVLRRKNGGSPWVRFDNTHAVGQVGRGYRRKQAAYDHWHRTAKDTDRPYSFATAAKLLDVFWREVKRPLDEEGISHDL